MGFGLFVFMVVILTSTGIVIVDIFTEIRPKFKVGDVLVHANLEKWEKPAWELKILEIGNHSYRYEITASYLDPWTNSKPFHELESRYEVKK